MTLEQIVTEIKKFASAHKQIKSFVDAEVWQVINNKSQLYPFMTSVETTSSISDGEESFSFQFGFFDKLNLDMSNGINVQSDMRLIATDFMAYLRNNPNMANVDIDFPVSLDYFLDKTDDGTGGCFINVNIRQFQGLNQCSIPMTGVSPGASQGNNIYDQNGNILYTLYPGQNLTIEKLQQIIQTLTDPAPITLIQTLT